MRIVVGKVDDFENGDRKIVDVNGKSIGVFRVDDRFYALRNRCPHQFGPLCAGELAPRAVSDGPGDMRLASGPPLLACPWHGWEYDLATGQSFMGPGRGNLAVRRYDVDVRPGRDLLSAGESSESQESGESRESRGSQESRARPDGRVPGPYVAETVPVSVEHDYVVIDDSPAR
jgi:nitrite reductase/ring-hydroxylating ferredoxin subunit